MSARRPLDLLEKVRVYVLEYAALGRTVVALSRITLAIDAPQVLGNPQIKQITRRWSWSGAGQKKPSSLGRRGHVQRCLSELAKTQVMWERQRAEPGRFNGERCDKYFRIRITKDEAITELRRLGRKVPVRQEGASAHWTPSLGSYPAGVTFIP
jgi:hypothetical protein